MLAIDRYHSHNAKHERGPLLFVNIPYTIPLCHYVDSVMGCRSYLPDRGAHDGVVRLIEITHESRLTWKAK